jgi:nucleoid DNA-binding protein
VLPQNQSFADPLYSAETSARSSNDLVLSIAKNGSHRFSGCTTHATSQSSSSISGSSQRSTSIEWCWKSIQRQKASNLRGFGSLRTRHRKSRVGRNPKTGDRVEVPAKRIPFFKPSQELKNMVNSYGEQHPHLQAAPESTVPLG